MDISFLKIFNFIIMVFFVFFSIFLAIFDGFIGNGVIAILSFVLLICIFLDFCLNSIFRYKIAINLLILIIFSVFSGLVKNSKINDEMLLLSGKSIEEVKGINLKYIYIVNGNVCTYLVYYKYDIFRLISTDDNRTKVCIKK